jgi:hypothetical protein
VALKIERVVDRRVGGEEALRRGQRLEPAHLALASSNWKERVFRAVVFSESARPMTRFKPEFSQRRTVRWQAIGDDRLRSHVLIAEETLQQFRRSAGVAVFLHDEVQNFAFIIDGAPQKDALAGDAANHLVEMPPRGRCSSPAPEVLCDQRTELVHPATDGPVADADPALSQKFCASRKLSGKRKYSQTVCRITSAGER